MPRLATWPDEVPPLGPLRLGWRDSLLWAQHVPGTETPMQVAAHLMSMEVPGEMLDCLPSAWPTMGPPGSFLLANPAIPADLADALAAREIAGEGGATVAFSPRLGRDRLAQLVGSGAGEVRRRLSALCWRQDLDIDQTLGICRGLLDRGWPGHIGALLCRSPLAQNLLRTEPMSRWGALWENPGMPAGDLARRAGDLFDRPDSIAWRLSVFRNPALPPEFVWRALSLPFDHLRIDARAAEVLTHARLDAQMQRRGLEIVAGNSRGLAAAALGRNRHLDPAIQADLGRASYLGLLALADNPWADPGVLGGFAHDPPVADPVMKRLARQALSRNPAISEETAEALAAAGGTDCDASNGRLWSPDRHRAIAGGASIAARVDLAANPTLGDLGAMSRLARDRSSRVKYVLAQHPLLAHPSLVGRLRRLEGIGEAIMANRTAAALLGPGDRGHAPPVFFPSARGSAGHGPAAAGGEEHEPEIGP